MSEAYAPLMGMYVATKHAVKGFTDVLRVEIEEVDKAPVSITLIQPGATDTPFPQHARNVTDKEPKLPTPQDDPGHVAEAILAAAETPTREKKVSVSASLNVMLAKAAGGVADYLSGKRTSDMHYDEPPRHPDGALPASGPTPTSSRTSGTTRTTPAGSRPTKRASGRVRRRPDARPRRPSGLTAVSGRARDPVPPLHVRLMGPTFGPANPTQ